MTMNDLLFDEKLVNDQIVYWRKRKAAAAAENDTGGEITCGCYIDAYQSVRIAHGLGCLPEDTDNEK